jgi:hypothetical protein
MLWERGNREVYPTGETSVCKRKHPATKWIASLGENGNCDNYWLLRPRFSYGMIPAVRAGDYTNDWRGMSVAAG